MKMISTQDLKNTVGVEKRYVKEQGSVYVSKNGYKRLVIMDIDYYEKTMQKMYEAKAVIEGLKDLKEGNIEDGAETICRLRKKYGV
ncbi:type II toxin-antitoxin system Phd/YefM family antitoxin [Oribacterium parvum]|uniref:type II toxin-antitoxin system Phd/YefM family antitoxin n=1 Tax=Oribacterium parvum TaxID=1501329 RepID=UPI0028E83FD2|nr:type II toxin-antitoxin system Phd/YefM family antitoxin [Oribacterium parvum]